MKEQFLKMVEKGQVVLSCVPMNLVENAQLMA